MVKANVIDALVARPGIFDVALFEGVEKSLDMRGDSEMLMS